MSDHTRALIPIGCSLFNSPELSLRNQSVDVGLLAEAIIYYDQVLVYVDNQKQFGELLEWFIQRNLYSKLLDLINDGSLQIYINAFRTNIHVDGENISLINVVEEAEHKPDSFFDRYLGNDEVKKRFPRRKQLYELREALIGKVIEAKVEEYGLAGIENAERDFLDPRRCALLLQTAVDELYRMKSLANPPEVKATLIPSQTAEGQVRVEWNVDFAELSKHVGMNLVFGGRTLALSGAVIGNTYIWSAERLECDLYLSTPISHVVGDKLYEAERTLSKTRVKAQSIIETLDTEVEFPDVRRLVNTNYLNFMEALKIRGKAKRFRQWLQTEADRDRDALIAYHHEVAEESGIKKVGRKSLKLFGVIGGASAGAAVAATFGQSQVAGAAIGAAAEKSLEYVLDLGAKIGEEWKPVVFGNWYKRRIEKLLEKRQRS